MQTIAIKNYLNTNNADAYIDFVVSSTQILIYYLKNLTFPEQKVKHKIRMHCKFVEKIISLELHSFTIKGKMDIMRKVGKSKKMINFNSVEQKFNS